LCTGCLLLTQISKSYIAGKKAKKNKVRVKPITLGSKKKPAQHLLPIKKLSEYDVTADGVTVTKLPDNVKSHITELETRVKLLGVENERLNSMPTVGVVGYR